MGETARERFHRQQEERARSASEATAAAPVQAAKPRRDTMADLLARRVLHNRRVKLEERLSALGLPVVLSELPEGAEELAELERFADEQERAAQ